MNRLENILTLFFLTVTTTVTAQNASNVVNNKVILSSRIENGYRIQQIKEGNHEYTLQTPVELIQQEPIEVKEPQPVVNNIVFRTNDNYITYVAPEVQTPELISERLRYSSLGLPLDYNEQVQKEIDRFLTNRSMLENALGRSEYFLPEIESVIISKNMPGALKYLPLVESAYKPKSYSRSGARGIWQFMKGTARLYKLKVDSTIDERLNPSLSTNAATEFLGDLYERFGDWNLALAAYNCGPGRVNRAINASGIENPTFWEIQPFLPRETKRYVPKFIAATYIMEYAGTIGLLPNIEGYELAKAQTEELQQKNFLTTVKKEYAVSAIPANSSLVTYTVKSGDNLGFIAEWYDTSAGRLRGWNGISGNLIKPGQKLKVYVPKDKEQLYAKIDRLPTEKKNEKLVVVSQVRTTSGTSSKKYEQYVIQKGDTLWEISRKNGVSVQEIKQLNNIVNTKNLMPGMVLKIREKS